MGTADGESFPKNSAFPLVPEKKSKIQVSGKSSKAFQVVGNCVVTHGKARKCRAPPLKSVQLNWKEAFHGKNVKNR